MHIVSKSNAADQKESWGRYGDFFDGEFAKKPEKPDFMLSFRTLSSTFCNTLVLVSCFDLFSCYSAHLN
jgi:hypothetical protein